LSQIAGSTCSKYWEFAANIAAAMNESGIGVQQILPRAGTRWQGGQHAPERRNDDQRDDDAPPSAPEHAPAPPGTGLIVDKSV